MLVIDGSHGEGGGQILRTSLGLSLFTGVSFRIVGIRAGRPKAGLMRQHITCVEAAAAIGRAQVKGLGIGSMELTFEPKGVVPGHYRFSVGTAGSTTLVLQSILPALWTASGPSELTLEGGTHNAFAPPFEFLDRSFLPQINRMGPRIQSWLRRAGFFPVGGGSLTVTVEPSTNLIGFDLMERGRERRRAAKAIVSALPRSIAERELAVVAESLQWHPNELAVEEVASPRGPGNAVVLEMEYEHVTEVCTTFGRRGVKAETVARQAVNQVQAYWDSTAPVGVHLADQLLVPLALAGRGSFRTMEPTPHTRTNIDIVQKFLPVEFSVTPFGQSWTVEVRPKTKPK